MTQDHNTQALPGIDLDKLSGDIMNIPCKRADSEFVNAEHRMLYKNGHRDARHAAAELVNDAAAQALATQPSTLTDAQIAAGAAVIGDDGKPIGRNTAIMVADAMASAALEGRQPHSTATEGANKKGSAA